MDETTPKLKLSLPDWVRKTTITDEDWRLYWSWENARTRHHNHEDERFDNPYRRYLDTLHWKRFRACVMILAEHTCADCEGQATDIHHLTYANLGKESIFDVMPLCQTCHMKRHGGGPLAVEVMKVLRALDSAAVG